MARRPNLERPVALKLMLPETVRARLDLLLWSEVEGKVPLGRYQEFFLGLLNNYFERLKETQPCSSSNPPQDS